MGLIDVDCHNQLMGHLPAWSRSGGPSHAHIGSRCRLSTALIFAQHDGGGPPVWWGKSNSGFFLLPSSLFGGGKRSFFCCIAELAIKPCRSSRSKLRGEFGIPNTCKTGNKNTTKQQTPPNPKHNTTQKKNGKCLECETRGEKRVKRPKRPNALICRTPGGSMRYPLSSSLGIMLISHSIVSIPASPSWFAI